MELAEGSVKSHLHDARQRLRGVIDRRKVTDATTTARSPRRSSNTPTA